MVEEQVVLADCPAIKLFAALFLEDHCLTDAQAEGLVSPAGHRGGAFACGHMGTEEGLPEAIGGDAVAPEVHQQEAIFLAGAAEDAAETRDLAGRADQQRPFIPRLEDLFEDLGVRVALEVFGASPVQEGRKVVGDEALSGEALGIIVDPAEAAEMPRLSDGEDGTARGGLVKLQFVEQFGGFSGQRGTVLQTWWIEFQADVGAGPAMDAGGAVHLGYEEALGGEAEVNARFGADGGACSAAVAGADVGDSGGHYGFPRRFFIDCILEKSGDTNA